MCRNGFNNSLFYLDGNRREIRAPIVLVQMHKLKIDGVIIYSTSLAKFPMLPKLCSIIFRFIFETVPLHVMDVDELFLKSAIMSIFNSVSDLAAWDMDINSRRALLNT